MWIVEDQNSEIYLNAEYAKRNNVSKFKRWAINIKISVKIIPT